MTKREQERLNELLAKKEAEEAADREFFHKVKLRKKEVIKVLGVMDPLEGIAKMYGCTPNELLDYMQEPQVISYYKRKHENK